jgi:two-component system sensor histidine kinase KdpD
VAIKTRPFSIDRRLKSAWITEDQTLAVRLGSALSVEGWESLAFPTLPEIVAAHSVSPFDMLVIDSQLEGMAKPGALQEAVNKFGGAPILLLRGDGGQALEITSGGPLCQAPRDTGAWKDTCEPMIHLFMEKVRDGIELEIVGRKLILFQTITKTAEIASSANRSLEENMADALKITLEAMNASRGSIMLADKGGNTLVVQAATNPDIIGKTQSLDSGSIASVAIRQNTVIRGDNRDISSANRADKERGYKSPHLLTIPISFQGAVIGVINVTDKVGDTRFSTEDESMFSIISGVIITALLSAEVLKERDRLNDTNAKLKELQSFKETMMHMLVHDLKGPAGDVISNLSVLREYVTGDFATELLDVAESSSEELLEMIMSILDLNKIEEGRFIIHKVETDIVRLAREATRKTQMSAQRENKTVTFATQVETLMAVVDERILSRVIWNLLSNANNHTSGGGEIKVSVAPRVEGGFVVTVSDNGSGIQEEYLDKLFEKFYQADETTHSRHSSGLGLTFCKMAMEAHGGSISVESQPGIGTSFSINMPGNVIENTLETA